MESSLSQLAQVKPGGHPLRREVVVRHQRERIFAAVIDLVAEQGYRHTSVAQIIKRAGVSKLKFYENFSSKEEAFTVAFDDAVKDASKRVLDAADAAASDPGARINAGISALLDLLAERPGLGRACVVEAPSLGSRLADRRDAALAAFSPLLTGLRDGESGERLPSTLEETTLEGLYWLLYEVLASGERGDLHGLQQEFVEFALLPFLGPAAAHEAAAS